MSCIIPRLKAREVLRTEQVQQSKAARPQLYIPPGEFHVQKCRVKREGFALRRVWEEMRAPSVGRILSSRIPTDKGQPQALQPQL